MTSDTGGVCMSRFILIFSALLMQYFLLLPTVHAQDANAELYDPVAPAGSAFVRGYNRTANSVEITLAGKSSPLIVRPGQLSAYRFVANGKQAIRVGTENHDAQLPPDRAMTIVIDEASVLFLPDPFVQEPRKAQVALYNLTTVPISLKTQDGKHQVVSATNPNMTAGRAVNEIKIAFAVFNEDRMLSQFEALFLRKGRTYSYFIVDDSTGLRAWAQESTVDPTP
jgi:alginate O-acetyltransferase complex protein AlgF